MRVALNEKGREGYVGLWKAGNHAFGFGTANKLIFLKLVKIL